MNNWGSSWEFTNYTNQNWWDLNIELVDAQNAGGSQFAKDHHAKDTGVNPFLRVSPRQTPETISTTTPSENSEKTTDTREYIYATEAFDRQPPSIGKFTNSRWRANHHALHVPVLDDRLAVAFQKLMRDEEAEFMLLLIAAETTDFHGHYRQ